MNAPGLSATSMESSESFVRRELRYGFVGCGFRASDCPPQDVINEIKKIPGSEQVER